MRTESGGRRRGPHIALSHHPRRHAITIALVAAALLLVTSFPAEADTNFKVGTFNMAGGHKDHGASQDDRAPDALVRSIAQRRPAAVFLQEACDDWNRRLREELPAYNIAFVKVLDGRGDIQPCQHPHSVFGLAVLYRADLGFEPPEDAQQHDLGAAAGEERRMMLCIRAPQRSLVACSAHLSNGPDAAASRRAQASRIDQILATNYRGQTVLLGADVNDPPQSTVLDRLYHTGYGGTAAGRFKEVDSPCGNLIVESPLCRDGEETLDVEWAGDKKYDYLFVSPSVTVLGADATDARHSDHDPLWADIVL